jgi:hypothetical protein
MTYRIKLDKEKFSVISYLGSRENNNTTEGNRVFLYNNIDKEITGFDKYLESQNFTFDPNDISFIENDIIIFYNFEDRIGSKQPYFIKFARISNVTNNTLQITILNTNYFDEARWGNIVGLLSDQTDLQNIIDDIYADIAEEAKIRLEEDEKEAKQRQEADDAEAEARIKGDIDTLAAANLYTDQEIEDALENAGTFIGVSFATYAELEAFEIPDKDKQNDFTYVMTDETKEGATTRYIINIDGEGNKSWVYAYTLNQNFSASQMAAINSGITKLKIETIDNSINDLQNNKQDSVVLIKDININSSNGEVTIIFNRTPTNTVKIKELIGSITISGTWSGSGDTHVFTPTDKQKILNNDNGWIIYNL